MARRSRQRNEHLRLKLRAAAALVRRGCGLHLPTVPEALAPLLLLVVVALFLITFVLQPYLIPSESMEHTLLVGDFLLVNKQVYAPSGSLSRWLLPYREVARGDIVVFHHPQPPFSSSGWWAFPATGCASMMAA